MRLIVDTNIFISALLSPESTIADLIINKIRSGSLFAPHFLFDEVLSKQLKIIKISGYSQEEFHDLMYILIKRIELLDSEHITNENWKKAQNLLENIDPWDIEFVALSLQTGYPIWTGDKKLVKGLKAKGFGNCILTKDLATRIRKSTI